MSVRAAALLALVTLAAGCGPRAPEPPPRVGREDPVVHVGRIGKTWVHSVEERGSLGNDPFGVASFVVAEEVAFDIGPSPKRTLQRDETFVLAGGRELHCRVQGDLPLDVKATWEGREVHVRLDAPAGRLPRRCTDGEFPVKARDVGAWSAVYALREDRLVPLSPPQLHDVLLPR